MNTYRERNYHSLQRSVLMASKVEMVKSVSFLLFSLAVFLTSSQAKSIIQQPQPSRSFSLKIQNTQSLRSCSYTVTIRTSCSSTSYTRDRISLAFGDSFGNQVYVPRLDDPSTGTFERCSTDAFKISGPCTYQICYLYLFRTGYDGLKPESVKISGSYVKTVTFYYDTFIPNGVWFGFNLCNDISTSAAM